MKAIFSIIFFMGQLSAASLWIYNETNIPLTITPIISNASLADFEYGFQVTTDMLSTLGYALHGINYTVSTAHKQQVNIVADTTITIPSKDYHYYDSGTKNIIEMVWQYGSAPTKWSAPLRMPVLNTFGKLKIYEYGRFDSSRLGDNQQAQKIK